MKETKVKKTSPSRFWKWMKRLLLLVIVSIIIALLLLKFRTQNMARLTDTALRPIFGPRIVLFLEKTYFNASDRLEMMTTDQSSVQAPQFLNQADPIATVESNLSLDAIAPNGSFPVLAEEGVWHNHPLSLFPGKEIMAYTFVRPDPKRSYALTTLLQIDSSAVRMGSVAGKEQPGGPVGKPGPGLIPSNIIESGKLVAAFDGGFQYRDGAYGMIVGNTTYLPLKNDLGTVVGYQDGSLKIVRYSGQVLGDKVAFVRQNCPILIEHGEVTVSDERNKTLWGRLAKGTVDIYTWRSGLGLTKEGNIIFAVGNNLTPQTLADALKMGGAVDAIQLDINPIWVRFNIFEPTDTLGQYTSSTLTKELQDGSKEYLQGYSKDFFYLYARS